MRFWTLVMLCGCGARSELSTLPDASSPVAAADLVEKSPAPPDKSTCAMQKTLTFDPSSDAHDTDFMMLQEAKRGAAAETDAIKNESLDLHFATNPLPRVLRGTAGFYEDY